MTDDSHACPIGRCVVRVPSHQLMCRRHWGMVPRDIQSRVYHAWKNGRGAGTDEHTAAMKEAIAAAEAKVAER